MTDFQTPVARPYGSTPTRDRAIAYLTRTGNADLLPVLGLAAEPVKPRGNCPACGYELASHGGCNRRKACREATHRTEART